MSADALPYIPYGRQEVTPEDLAAVAAVLGSDFLTQGPAVGDFERAVAEYCGAAHAVAANSATSALHLACAALDLGPGDTLWTVPNTFVASANCARFCGAAVDFVDIDRQTRNISLAALTAKLAAAAASGTLPKIVVPVAFAGLACPMAEIGELARQYGFAVVEDASHAIGGSYRGAPVGCGAWADVSVFSFHPVKIITSGEGGMALTSNPTLAARMRRLATHGITRDAALLEEAPAGEWVYEMQELGWNYRMTDIQAALGRSQLRRIDAYVARRRALAARYASELAGLGLELPQESATARSAWHLYVVGWNAARAKISRSAAFAHLRAAGIGVNVHYIPVHLQPYYRRLGFQPGDFPEAEAHYARALSLPLYPGLSDAAQERVINQLRQLCQ